MKKAIYLWSIAVMMFLAATKLCAQTPASAPDLIYDTHLRETSIAVVKHPAMVGRQNHRSGGRTRIVRRIR